MEIIEYTQSLRDRILRSTYYPFISRQLIILTKHRTHCSLAVFEMTGIQVNCKEF
jgi:hypothetical protein